MLYRAEWFGAASPCNKLLVFHPDNQLIMFKIYAEKPEVDEALAENGRVYGTLTIKVFDRDGRLKAVRGPMRNLIVNIGKDFIAKQIGATITPSSLNKCTRWTGIGHSQTAAGASQTKLGSQRARRKNSYSHTNGTSYFSFIATYVTFGPGGSYSGKRKATIYESGLFWASQTQNNVMLCRQTFSAVTKLSADTLTVEWKISLS